ncbi:SIS domain-containing protein [Candidatus Woesearchaeota archaeon]|nr:SIS domain-containing protein [Candidatus Woesearchaeota archaeon]
MGGTGLTADHKFISNYLKETAEIIQQVDVNEVKKVVDILFEAWQQDKQVFVMGNGGSAAAACHLVCDLQKPTHKPGKQRFRAISLNDNVPVMSAWINDVGWDHLYAGQLEGFLNNGDVVVGFSVHGGSLKKQGAIWSQNMLKAMQYAKEKCAKTVGIAGFDGGAMKQMCDACIVVPKDSTPHVEGLHGVVHHMIITLLKQKMEVPVVHK